MPLGQFCQVFLAPVHKENDGKEEDEKAAQAHHQAESPEIHGDRRHQLSLVLDVSIAEILEVVLDDLPLNGCRSLIALGLCLTIGSECLNGFLSHGNLLVGRWLPGSVRTGIAIQEFIHSRHEAVRITRSHDGEGIRHGDTQRGLLFNGIVRLLERIHPCHGRQALVNASIVERLHRSQFHRLFLCHLLTGDMSRSGCQQGSHQSHDGTNAQALQGQLGLAFLHQVPAAHGHYKDGAHNPCRNHRMAEFHDSKGREGHIEERHHLVTHGIGIELTAHRTLHPGIGHQNPPGRNRGSQSRQPRGSQVEALGNLVPAEIHHSHEGALHEEGHDTLDG